MTGTHEILANNLDYTLFSWQKQAGLNPINASHAKGVYVFDREEQRYLDFSSQLVCVNIGHGDTRVAEAVLQQMQQLSFVFPGMATQVRGELGKKLAEITPGGLRKTFFTLGGADANENAIKLARVYTGRNKIVGMYKAYHGSTYATMAAAGDPRKHSIDALSPAGFIKIENPYYYRCPWYSDTEEQCAERALAHLQRVLIHENPEDVAAIILEGVSGSSGGIMYPAGYVQGVRAICDQYGILLISDEVMSGFGRTGKWFGIDHYDVEPDMMTMAKGMTSAYIPLGGVIVTQQIADAFNDRPLPLGLTYSAHPVACAAALRVLQIYEEDDLVARAAQMGEYMGKRIAELQLQHPSLGDYRRRGLLGCIELVRNRETREPLVPWNASAADSEPTVALIQELRKAGMYTLVRWNWIFTAPPLIITEAQIDEGIGMLDKALTVADRWYKE